MFLSATLKLHFSLSKSTPTSNPEQYFSELEAVVVVDEVDAVGGRLEGGGGGGDVIKLTSKDRV